MRMRTRMWMGVAGTIGMLGMSVPIASAAVSLKAGTNTCTVTALKPTLTTTGQLTGQASIVCTLATVLTLEIGVVELDGTVEDKVVEVAQKFTTNITLTANKAQTINSATAKCVSTETGNEEFATKVKINLTGTLSGYDRFVPVNDSFAC